MVVEAATCECSSSMNGTFAPSTSSPSIATRSTRMPSDDGDDGSDDGTLDASANTIRSALGDNSPSASDGGRDASASGEMGPRPPSPPASSEIRTGGFLKRMHSISAASERNTHPKVNKMNNERQEGVVAD